MYKIRFLILRKTRIFVTIHVSVFSCLSLFYANVLTTYTRKWFIQVNKCFSSSCQKPSFFSLAPVEGRVGGWVGRQAHEGLHRNPDTV